MDTPIVKRGTPWLDFPLVFSGNYREYECSFNDTELCDYQEGYWRFWYEADHRYALPTIAFFLSTIIIFALIYAAGNVVPQRVLQKRSLSKIRAFFRYLSYRTIRIPALDWNSAPVGFLLLAAVGTIFFFCMTLAPKPYYWPNTDDVDFGSSPPIATRAGWMALACMPFIFATAGKVNLITIVTGTSHEVLQIYHRWISYAFLVLALIHTFPFIVYNIQWGMMTDMWNMSVFYWTGVVALIAQAWLTFASWGPLRNWCYEWFKFSHFVAALVFMLFFFFHCDATLTAWDYFVATGVLFSVSWLSRQSRIYFEHGFNLRAEISIAANGYIQVLIPTNARWTTGQHFFIRFLTLGSHALTVHPFTACSLPLSGRKGSKYESELVLYIRPRKGFTARLANFAQSHPNAKVRVLLDGPYGGVDVKTIANSQRSLVIAGGSGAGWTLPFITEFLRTSARGATSANVGLKRSLKVILVTRDLLTTKWFEEQVLQLIKEFSSVHNPIIEIEIYYTGSEANKENPAKTGQFLQALNEPADAIELNERPAESISLSNTPKEDQVAEAQLIQHLESRPKLSSVVQTEAESIGLGKSLGIFVCGPLSLQSDVSRAVASEELRIAKRGSGDISLHLEHFSWA